MFCKNCGTALSVGQKFCGSCGASQAISSGADMGSRDHIPGVSHGEPVNSPTFTAIPVGNAQTPKPARNRALQGAGAFLAVCSGFVAYNAASVINFLNDNNFVVASFSQTPVFALFWGGKYYGYSGLFYARAELALLGRNDTLVDLPSLQGILSSAIAVGVIGIVLVILGRKK